MDGCTWNFLVSLTSHVNVKLICKYPPYHCVPYEDNEVTWCPVLNINKTRSIAAETATPSCSTTWRLLLRLSNEEVDDRVLKLLMEEVLV